MNDPAFLFLSDQIDSVQSRIPGFPLSLNCKLALDSILNRFNALVLTHQIGAEQIRQFSEIHRLVERREYQEIAALVGQFDTPRDSERSPSVSEMAPSVSFSATNSAGPGLQPAPALCSGSSRRPEACSLEPRGLEQSGSTHIAGGGSEALNSSLRSTSKLLGTCDSPASSQHGMEGARSNLNDLAGAKAASQRIQSQAAELRRQMEQLNVSNQQLLALCECAESHCRVALQQPGQAEQAFQAAQAAQLQMELAAALNQMLRLALVKSEQAIIRRQLVVFDFQVPHAVIYRAPRADPQISAAISGDLAAAAEMNAALRTKLDALAAEQRDLQVSQRGEGGISPENTVRRADSFENDNCAAQTVCARPSPYLKRAQPRAKTLHFDGLRQEIAQGEQPAQGAVPKHTASPKAPARQGRSNAHRDVGTRQPRALARPKTTSRQALRCADALAQSTIEQLAGVLGVILGALEGPGIDGAPITDPGALELFTGLLNEARAAKDLKPSLLQIERLAARLQALDAAAAGVEEAQRAVKAIAVSGRRNKQRYTAALQRVCVQTLECICRRANSLQECPSGKVQAAAVRARSQARAGSAQSQSAKTHIEKSGPAQRNQAQKQRRASPAVATPSLQRHTEAQSTVSPKELRVAVVEKRKSPQAAVQISKLGILSIRNSTAAQTTDSGQQSDRSNAAVQTKHEIELTSRDVQTDIVRRRPRLGAFCEKLAHDFQIPVNKRGIAWAAAEYPLTKAVEKYCEISAK